MSPWGGGGGSGRRAPSTPPPPGNENPASPAVRPKAEAVGRVGLWFAHVHWGRGGGAEVVDDKGVPVYHCVVGQTQRCAAVLWRCCPTRSCAAALLSGGTVVMWQSGLLLSEQVRFSSVDDRELGGIHRIRFDRPRGPERRASARTRIRSPDAPESAFDVLNSAQIRAPRLYQTVDLQPPSVAVQVPSHGVPWTTPDHTSAHRGRGGGGGVGGLRCLTRLLK